MKGSLSWTNGHCINVVSLFSDTGRYLYLNYTTTRQGEVKRHDYKIRLAAVPSNLGKGEVLYFVCPASGRLCRFLIFSNHMRQFVSRKALPERIFYDSQTSSKLSLANDRYWSVRRKLERLVERKETFSYNGKDTRYALRKDRLLEKMHEADEQRWGYESMPVSLRREALRLAFGGDNP